MAPSPRAVTDVETTLLVATDARGWLGRILLKNLHEVLGGSLPGYLASFLPLSVILPNKNITHTTVPNHMHYKLLYR